MKFLACEQVGQAHGSVYVVAGLARASAVRGRARQATGDEWHHAAVIV